MLIEKDLQLLLLLVTEPADQPITVQFAQSVSAGQKETKQQTTQSFHLVNKVVL